MLCPIQVFNLIGTQLGRPCFHLNTPFQARQRGLRFGLSDKTSTVFWVLLEHNDIWVLTKTGCCVIIVISCSYSTIKSPTAAGNTGWHCFLFFLPARGVSDLASAVKLQQIDGCFWRIMTWVYRGRTTWKCWHIIAIPNQVYNRCRQQWMVLLLHQHTITIP